MSGSFHAFDTGYYRALRRARKGFVGVEQVPIGVSDHPLLDLNEPDARSVRPKYFSDGERCLHSQGGRRSCAAEAHLGHSRYR